MVLETGNPLLAATVAGEWLFWETGNVDVLTAMIGAPRMLRTVAYGALAILLAGTVAFLRSLRASRA